MIRRMTRTILMIRRCDLLSDVLYLDHPAGGDLTPHHMGKGKEKRKRKNTEIRTIR